MCVHVLRSVCVCVWLQTCILCVCRLNASRGMHMCLCITHTNTQQYIHIDLLSNTPYCAQMIARKRVRCVLCVGVIVHPPSPSFWLHAPSVLCVLWPTSPVPAALVSLSVLGCQPGVRVLCM